LQSGAPALCDRLGLHDVDLPRFPGGSPIDIVPVVFGRGKPYFGTLTNGHLMLGDPEVVIQGDRVLHLRYPVHRGR
jgi:hypothetical protein